MEEVDYPSCKSFNPVNPDLGNTERQHRCGEKKNSLRELCALRGLCGEPQAAAQN